MDMPIKEPKKTAPQYQTNDLDLSRIAPKSINEKNDSLYDFINLIN